MDAELRTCTRCGQTKPLDDYTKNRRSMGGRLRRCKACRAADANAWYWRNREKVRAQQREYQKRHPGVDAARAKAWRERQKATGNERGTEAEG